MSMLLRIPTPKWKKPKRKNKQKGAVNPRPYYMVSEFYSSVMTNKSLGVQFSSKHMVSIFS